MAAAFPRAADAVEAAADAQRALSTDVVLRDVKVRMAVHTGEAEERDGNYFGPTLSSRVARRDGWGGRRADAGVAGDGRGRPRSHARRGVPPGGRGAGMALAVAAGTGLRAALVDAAVDGDTRGPSSRAAAPGCRRGRGGSAGPGRKRSAPCWRCSAWPRRRLPARTPCCWQPGPTTRRARALEPCRTSSPACAATLVRPPTGWRAGPEATGSDFDDGASTPPGSPPSWLDPTNHPLDQPQAADRSRRGGPAYGLRSCP